MKTVLEIIRLAEGYLKERKLPRARREAEDLVADVLGLRRLDLYVQFERPLVEKELNACREALKRRAAGEPLQYIAGKVEFAGVTIEVNRNVLIPRPETEILIEMIASTLAKESLEGRVLLDLCAGSGYIGIALKKRFPALEVILSDLSEEALAVAQCNAERNGVDVTILQGDLVFRECDYFVSNPPYVTAEEWLNLDKSVRDFEPKMALIGGPSGLEFYIRIATVLKSYLKLGGKAWFEIGAGQGGPVKEIFQRAGWKNCTVESDWAGHDRFLCVFP